jgi:hypothetical protein
MESSILMRTFVGADGKKLLVGMGVSWVEMAADLRGKKGHPRIGRITRKGIKDGENEDEKVMHPPSPPVQGATVLHRLARWHEMAIQGAT